MLVIAPYEKTNLRGSPQDRVLPETTIMSEHQSQQVEPDQGYITFLLFSYGVKCPHCNKPSFDPDKKKNQVFLKNRCPECGKDPKNYRNPNKKPKKFSKKEKKRLQREADAAARGKY